ncbi:MAG: hypothetical protein GY845_15825 [Planctomycetes bacterium]|nr:hypothetical protein [Planctomycetota bacterium]
MKSRIMLLFCLATLICSYGCQPIPYQKLGTTSAGGYSDKRLSENIFYVRFVANNNTPPNTVRDYLYRRAAEVTIKNGFAYFTIIRGPSRLTERMQMHQSLDHYKDRSDPIEFDVPDLGRLQMTIQCFKDIQDEEHMNLIDARMYLEKQI